MKTLQLAVLAFGMSLGTQAAAQFSFTCHPPTEYEIGPVAPNVLLMLDMSGSMNNSSGEDVDGNGSHDSLYKVARLAITDVANSTYDPGPCPGNCDSVRLGLGYFPSNGNLGASSATIVGEDRAPPIITWLNGNSPGGGTPTGDAMSYVANTAELRDSTRPNVAVLVTDGEPSAVGQSEALLQGRTAINRACEARNRTDHPQVTTFVVGFGAGSNEQVNSATAAAGGTGMCCAGASAPCAEDAQVDPCVVGANTILPAASAGPGGYYVTSLGPGYSCSGSLEATGSQIKDQLLAILSETSCTFALDIPPGYPSTGADPDPEATEVRIWHGVFGSSIPIPPAGDSDTLPDYLISAHNVDPAVAAEYHDEGWEFTNASRQFVRLSPKLCADVQMGDIDRVSTVVACLCEFEGEACTYVYDGPGSPFTNSQIERMRCGEGTYICVNSQDVCSPTLARMPEICNGLDDDCDGKSDNMSTSWDDPEFAGLSLPADHLGLDCQRKDVCVCPGPVPLDHTPGDFDDFLDGWSSVCLCGEGLEPTRCE